MESAFDRVVLDRPHAYGLRWRGQVVAHIWWEQDVVRRGALGWYLRDLRAPARVWRLDIDEALDVLAQDRRRPAAAWTADAERLRALTTALALRRAEGLLGETLELPGLEHGPADAVAYDVYVRGLTSETVALAFPEIAVSASEDVQVLHAELTSGALSRLLGRIASLGGTVTAITRSGED
jgi:hypothetical protein